jgi:hypothetical protein
MLINIKDGLVACDPWGDYAIPATANRTGRQVVQARVAKLIAAGLVEAPPVQEPGAKPALTGAGRAVLDGGEPRG